MNLFLRKITGFLSTKNAEAAIQTMRSVVRKLRLFKNQNGSTVSFDSIVAVVQQQLSIIRVAVLYSNPMKCTICKLSI